MSSLVRSLRRSAARSHGVPLVHRERIAGRPLLVARIGKRFYGAFCVGCKRELQWIGGEMHYLGGEFEPCYCRKAPNREGRGNV